ncbi:MAG: TonB-dependent receptor domain-containing protein, partial [Rhodothalassiaceae bacterium]
GDRWSGPGPRSSACARGPRDPSARAGRSGSCHSAPACARPPGSGRAPGRGRRPGAAPRPAPAPRPASRVPRPGPRRPPAGGAGGRAGAGGDADRRRAFDAFYGRVYADLSLLDDIWTQALSLALTDTASDTFADGAFVSRFAGRRWKLVYQSTLTTGLGALTAAVEHEALDFTSRAADPADPSNQKQSDDQTSFVGEWRSDVAARAFLTVGVRRDLNGTFADATTWRATASYRLAQTLRLHGSYGTGVSDPTFFDRFGFFPDFFVGNPDLRPEKARGWDAGVTYRTPGDDLRLDVTYFASELRDEITPSFDVVTFLSSVENQAGVSDRKGVEFSGEARLGGHLHLRASYTYLDATEPDGSREVRRAKQIASLGAVYRLPEERGELSLALDYNGRQDDLDFSTFPATRVVLDDFLLATLSLRYRLLEGVDLIARLENALDADYRNVFGFNTPGIGAFAGLSLRF